jgi:transposase
LSRSPPRHGKFLGRSIGLLAGFLSEGRDPAAPTSVQAPRGCGSGKVAFTRAPEAADLLAAMTSWRRTASATSGTEAAAAAVLSGKARHFPRASAEKVEMIRALRIARASAAKARTQASNAIKALVVMAPEALREALRNLPTGRLVSTCARFRPGQVVDPTAATKTALRSLAVRCQALEAEARELEIQLDQLTSKTAPLLRSSFGVGSDSAAALPIAAGDNPARLRSDSSFSMLCGSSPLPASSGQTKRHRLNRGGDRQANAALHRIVMTRLRWHGPTKAYMQRRLAQGKSKPEVIRCLKRYVAREVFGVLAPAPNRA